MNKQEYINDVGDSLVNILKDETFVNNKNQVIAWGLKAEFNRTYDENYLWSRALSLSTNACMLLLEGDNEKLALKALKESAEIYEYLAKVTEKYDAGYSLILSSLCYDLAGYQANAYCLIKQVRDYEFANPEGIIDISSDNYILSHIKQILLKNIFQARNHVDIDLDDDLGLKLFNDSVSSWYKHVLDGDENEFLRKIEKTYSYYLNAANVHISHLLFLLKTRFKMYLERSILENLKKYANIEDNYIWKKYIRILAHDFYSEKTVKDIDNRISIFEFWVSQIRALEKGLLNTDDDYVIQMPTSTGKTFIAELKILDTLVKKPGQKCIYIAPYRALTNEKERELSSNLAKLGYSVSALSGSYEVDEFQDVILREADVLVATPEKIDLLFRMNPDFFNEVSLVVVDEGHIIGEISTRSSLLEFLIIRFKARFEQLKMLFISAVMPPGNADEYSIWLSGKDSNVIRSLLHPDSSVHEEWEPTRKLIGRFDWYASNGRITFKNVKAERESSAFVPSIIKEKQFAGEIPDKRKKKETSASLAFELSKNGNCLVFCAQPRYALSVGESLLRIIQLSGDNQPSFLGENEDRGSYFYAKMWYGVDHCITKCLKHGVGIHYGNMPDAVKHSIEADYKSGELRILLATNTIGQGLNFPIKYIVIHHTIIHHPLKISVGDFWNIVGRAGRAGKETEGQVVFVINSYSDNESFNKYTDINNIDPAESIIYKVLKSLVSKRISNSTLNRYMEILSESYLLDMLIEEVAETDDQELIESIISKSLFKVQADKSKLDIEPLRKSMNHIVTNIRENISKEMIRVFAETGFSVKSNMAIEKEIESNLGAYKNLIETDDYFKLLTCILLLFEQGEVSEVLSHKLDNLQVPISGSFEILELWIKGGASSQLQEKYQAIGASVDDLFVLISEGLYYRYPWGITAFITILINKLNVKREDLPEGIKNLSSYVKYGLSESTACLARSLGIKTREAALILQEKADGRESSDFIKWVSNLTNEDVERFDVGVFERQNILQVATKLSPISYIKTPSSFNFLIKGIVYSSDRAKASKTIEKDELLPYNREFGNQYDPFAIKIFKGEQELGYVPREYSRIMSVDIDINYIEYNFKVVDVIPRDRYSDIKVQVSEKNYFEELLAKL